jgi:hypothetical protein
MGDAADHEAPANHRPLWRWIYLLSLPVACSIVLLGPRVTDPEGNRVEPWQLA